MIVLHESVTKEKYDFYLLIDKKGISLAGELDNGKETVTSAGLVLLLLVVVEVVPFVLLQIVVLTPHPRASISAHHYGTSSVSCEPTGHAGSSHSRPRKSGIWW